MLEIILDGGNVFALHPVNVLTGDVIHDLDRDLTVVDHEESHGKIHESFIALTVPNEDLLIHENLVEELGPHQRKKLGGLGGHHGELVDHLKSEIGRNEERVEFGHVDLELLQNGSGSSLGDDVFGHVNDDTLFPGAFDLHIGHVGREPLVHRKTEDENSSILNGFNDAGGECISIYAIHGHQLSIQPSVDQRVCIDRLDRILNLIRDGISCIHLLVDIRIGEFTHYFVISLSYMDLISAIKHLLN